MIRNRTYKIDGTHMMAWLDGTRSDDATEAVKRLVEAARFVVAANSLFDTLSAYRELKAALASFTETEEGSDDSGLRLCATPENDGSTAIKGDQHG